MKQRMLSGLMLAMMVTGPVPSCPSGDCPRTPSVTQDDPRYSRFESPKLKNDCRSDADCVVGGCGNEVCAAECAVSTCELLARRPAGECGCVNGSCVWFVEECTDLGATESRS